MKIHVYNRQNLIPLSLDSVRFIVKSIPQREGQKGDEAAVYFVEQEEICKLHQDHFNDPSPTDCISFPLDDASESPRHLGEIFINPQAAAEYTADTPDHLYRELSLYLVHGLLHLLGYDDQTPEEEHKMRLAEKRHMEYLESVKKLITP